MLAPVDARLCRPLIGLITIHIDCPLRYEKHDVPQIPMIIANLEPVWKDVGVQDAQSSSLNQRTARADGKLNRRRRLQPSSFARKLNRRRRLQPSSFLSPPLLPEPFRRI